MNILIELFLSFCQIGLFSIGGGMAAIPLIQNEVVEVHKWLTISEFSDLVTIAEMTPGPIAINAASFVGTKMYGALGAVVATLGSITPSIIIVSILAFVYFKFKNLKIMTGILESLKPAIVALIAGAGLTILKHALFIDNNINYISVFIFCLTLFLLKKYKLSPIILMFTTGILGTVLYLIFY